MYIIQFYFQGCLDRGPYSTNRIYTCGFCDFNWPILDLFYLKEDIISAPSIDHLTCYYNECQYKIDNLMRAMYPTGRGPTLEYFITRSLLTINDPNWKNTKNEKFLDSYLV